MRTYYRGPDALVTEERFVWRTPSPRIFAIRELHDVVLVRCKVTDYRPDVALMGAASVTALAVASWLLVGPIIGSALGFIAVLAAAVAVATRPHRKVWSWQVRARYHGVDVTVYASGDVRVFNQVTRALRRSLEDGRPAWRDPGLAVA